MTPKDQAPLMSVLRQLEPSLPKGPATVARHILARPRDVARLSLSQLAEATGTSESTVIRLATAAGYRGYRDMRIAVAVAAGELGEPGADDHHLTSDITLEDSPEETIAKLAAEERHAITDTAATLDPQQVHDVAVLLARARRIAVVGIGASGLVARDLASKLSRIGLVAHSVVEGHEILTTAVVMRPTDVLVLVTASGETRDILEPLDFALDHGVPTVALTARAGSSITRADHALVSVSPHETALRPAAMASRTGQMFLVDVLFTMVAQEMFDEAKSAITQSWLALRPRRGGPAGPKPTTGGTHE